MVSAEALCAAVLGLACVVGYCEVRHRVWDWRVGRGRLVAWYEAVAGRAGFLGTVSVG